MCAVRAIYGGSFGITQFSQFSQSYTPPYTLALGAVACIGFISEAP